MAVITDLPAEVILQVCSELGGADDLANLSQTCRSMNSLTKNNALLYKQLYLNHFDDPAEDPTYKKWTDWEALSKDIALVKRILKSGEEELLRKHRLLIVKTISTLLRTSNSKHDCRNKDFVTSIFPSDTRSKQSLLCRSSLYARALGIPSSRPRTEEDIASAKASAHLHCLYGKPQLMIGETLIQPYALSKVYDMRQYMEQKNGWGPFLDDASWYVDWEKIEAIMITLGAAIREISPSDDSWIAKLWSEPFDGTASHSYRTTVTRCPHAASRQPDNDPEEAEKKKQRRKLDEQDPYGVTGTYLRIVCFLDYRVLFNYNWGEMRPHRIDDPMHIINEQEATRLIAMSVAVDRIEWPEDANKKEKSMKQDSSERTDVSKEDTAAKDTTALSELRSAQIAAASSEDHDSSGSRLLSHSHATRSAEKKRREKRNKSSMMPIVHFTGTSRLMHAAWDPHANSRIKGTVQMTPEGEVRWTTTSIFNGNEERWKSEGIQIGGPRSGRGVVGTWFDCHYEAHGPAGPTSFWKIRDEVPEDMLDEGEEDFDELELQSDLDDEFVADDDDEESETGDLATLLLGGDVELVLMEGTGDE